MNTVTRRQFLIASGAAAVAFGVGGTVTWETLTREARSNPLPSGTRILVIVTLYGGNDGLQTVIPYTDAAYHDARPDFAYTADQVLPLSDGLGLNPALKGLSALWHDHRLAIIRGVDYPQPDFSHFRSMDIWQTASPADPVSTGWIGRWLDATGDDPLRAVNVGSVVPPLAVGTRSAAAALIPGRENPFPNDVGAAIAGLGRTDSTDTPSQVLVATSCRSERTVSATFGSILDKTSAPAGSSAPDHSSAAGTATSSNALATQLDLAAQCIAAGVPTKVYTASLGGFDTHADEKNTQERQLALLDSAVARFFAEIGKTTRAADVVMMIYTEFGRRVAANASDGTDHGSAGPVLLVGQPVRGGFYGEQPSLTDLDDGNLKWNVDFRSIYAELLDRTLHADPQQVLGGSYRALGVLL